MQEPGLGAQLGHAAMARRAALPLKPAPVTLTGSLIRLRPLDPDADAPGLYALSNGKPASLGARETGAYDAERLIWRYLSGGPFANAAELTAWLRAQADPPNARYLAVEDLVTGRPIGAASFMSNAPEHLKIELGNIWYSPIVQRSGANTEATYLMLRHAFELGYRRLEWKCDSLNERSRRAALRMGFTFEGIQEAHFIVKGRNRDTAWFRILAHEWPAIKEHLEGLLARS